MSKTDDFEFLTISDVESNILHIKNITDVYFFFSKIKKYIVENHLDVDILRQQLKSVFSEIKPSVTKFVLNALKNEYPNATSIEEIFEEIYKIASKENVKMDVILEDIKEKNEKERQDRLKRIKIMNLANSLG